MSKSFKKCSTNNHDHPPEAEEILKASTPWLIRWGITIIVVIIIIAAIIVIVLCPSIRSVLETLKTDIAIRPVCHHKE